jgi:hypothetical protein
MLLMPFLGETVIDFIDWDNRKYLIWKLQVT